jgi:hypothetical protein
LCCVKGRSPRVLAVLLDALTRGDAMRQTPGYLQCARWR